MKKTEFIAIDGAKIVLCGMSDSDWEALRKTARSLLKGWYVVADKGVPFDVKQKLRDSKGIQSVFSSSGALIITYPEIQVEETRKRNADLFIDWMGDNKDVINLLEEKEGRWLMEHRSGDGEKARKLVKEMKKKMDLNLCQSRFVRIINKQQ